MELLRRRVDLQPTEILVSVFLPFTQKLEYVKEFKQAHRRDDDIAIANGGMRVCFRRSADGVSRLLHASCLVQLSNPRWHYCLHLASSAACSPQSAVVRNSLPI